MSGESWVDKQGDVWRLGPDGLMHTPETRPFPREHVEKKWGPLHLIPDPATEPALFEASGLRNAVASDAEISVCGRYRYLLTRTWDPAIHRLPFVMLNPSTADAEHDDPTIRRCIGFARRHGYGGISVLNLYAYRATNPADLWTVEDPVGPDNDDWLRLLFDATRNTGRPVVAAWGANAREDRVRDLIAMRGAADVLHHLGLTKHGAPRHPLYLPADAPLTRWVRPTDEESNR